MGIYACGLIICLLFGWQGIQAAQPFRLAARLRAENDAIERSILRYRLQNQRLEKDIKALNTNAGIETEARKLGWVRRGESRLRVPQ